MQLPGFEALDQDAAQGMIICEHSLGPAVDFTQQISAAPIHHAAPTPGQLPFIMTNHMRPCCSAASCYAMHADHADVWMLICRPIFHANHYIFIGSSLEHADVRKPPAVRHVLIARLQCMLHYKGRSSTHCTDIYLSTKNMAINMEVSCYAGTQRTKPLAPWQLWSQMQDSFSSGISEASGRMNASIKKQPRFQTITAATFPPQCLTASNVTKQSRQVMSSDLQPARLVLNNRHMHNKTTIAESAAGHVLEVRTNNHTLV